MQLATTMQPRAMPLRRPASPAPRSAGRRMRLLCFQDTAAAANSPTARVRFELPFQTRFGENVAVVGSFSSWDPTAPLKMQWQEGGLWIGEAEVPVGQPVEYKYIVTSTDSDAVTWQPGNNLMLALSDAKAFQVMDDWLGNTHEIKPAGAAAEEEQATAAVATTVVVAVAAEPVVVPATEEEDETAALAAATKAAVAEAAAEMQAAAQAVAATELLLAAAEAQAAAEAAAAASAAVTKEQVIPVPTKAVTPPARSSLASIQAGAKPELQAAVSKAAVKAAAVLAGKRQAAATAAAALAKPAQAASSQAAVVAATEKLPPTAANKPAPKPTTASTNTNNVRPSNIAATYKRPANKGFRPAPAPAPTSSKVTRPAAPVAAAGAAAAPAGAATRASGVATKEIKPEPKGQDGKADMAAAEQAESAVERSASPAPARLGAAVASWFNKRP